MRRTHNTTHSLGLVTVSLFHCCEALPDENLIQLDTLVIILSQTDKQNKRIQANKSGPELKELELTSHCGREL